MRAEQLTDSDAEHGEGPVWWPGWGGLCWVDMLRGDVLRLSGVGPVDRWHVGSVVAALRPRGQSGLVLATEHAFTGAPAYGGPLTELAAIADDPALRFNEGGCDPEGRFLCGTMRYDGELGGTLYRLGTDLRVEPVLSGLTVSNGLAWDATGDRAYFVDTADRRVDLLDLSDGATRTPFVTIDPAHGDPDGLTVDAEGGIWVALWEGGRVHRYDRDGSLSEVIEVPVGKVTACTFGGSGLDELFITTSRHGEVAPQAAAGAVFRAVPGVRGLPARGFAG